MNVHIVPHTLSGEITAPPAKSYAHRWLIAAFLAGGGTLRHIGNSADVRATLGALQTMGMTAQFHQDEVRLAVGARITNATVYCGESGSTLRFLLPVAAALGIRATFTGEAGLMARPLSGLIDVLNAHGADITGTTVGGQLTAGDYIIDAGVSSQYITGLLFALPLLPSDSRIIFCSDEVVSKGYIHITLDVLARAGICVQAIQGGFAVKGNQVYRLPSTVTVEGDWSGAAFMLAAGALGGKVSVGNLNHHSLQGDLEILPLLERFGADARIHNGCATVCGRSLNGISIDIQPIPDLAQVLAVVGAFAQGTTTLKNVHRLRIKESDRLKAIMDMLHAARVECTLQDDCLLIRGGQPRGAFFAGGNDHRTVMSAAILAAYAQGESTLDDAEAVSKSYPDFWQDYHNLGGRTNGNI